MKNLIQWKPLSELDDFFSDNHRSIFPALQSDLAVDVYEENGSIIAKLSLPGIEKTEVTIAIDGDLLHVSGSREEESMIDNKNYYSKEIRRGSFARSVRLPKLVDADKSVANYDGGLLTITMPTIQNSKDTAIKVPIT